MTRISQYFSGKKEPAALISFLTAGDPTAEHTVPAMHALVAGGVDIIEIGVPFSDPEAEGPAIQASSERALANGMNLSRVLTMVAEFRRDNDSTPIVLMGYLNSVLSMPDFANNAAAAGVDGLIMVNLPPEASSELQAQLASVDIDLIYLVAPTTTDERARYILSHASGFMYYVSLKGTTGAGNLVVDEVETRLSSLRTLSKLPMCVGFGIKDGDVAGQVGKFADGVVVGSALVNLLAEHGGDVDAGAQALQAAARALRQGIDSA